MKNHLLLYITFIVLLAVAPAAHAAAPEIRKSIERTRLSSALAVTMGCETSIDSQVLDAHSGWLLLSIAGDTTAADRRRTALSQTAGGRVVVQPALSDDVPVFPRAAALIVIDADTLGSNAPNDTEIARALRPYGTAWIKRDGVWTSQTAPWPETIADASHWLGDASLSCKVPDAEVGQVRSLRWHTATRDSGHPFLVVADGVMVSMTTRGVRHGVAGFDAFTGLELWFRDDLDIEHNNTFTMDAQRVVLHSIPAPVEGEPWRVSKYRSTWRDDAKPEYLRAIDAKTGEDLITYSEGPDLASLRPKSARFPGKGDHVLASLHEGKLLVTAGDSLTLLDAATGRCLWQATHAGKHVLWPSVHDDRVICVVGGHIGLGAAHGHFHDRVTSFELAVAYDLSDGKELWRWRQDLYPIAACSFAAVSNGRYYAYLEPPGKMLGRVIENLPSDKRSAQHLVCLDPATGKPHWTEEVKPPDGGDPYKRVFAFDDNIVVNGGGFRMRFLDIEGRDLGAGGSAMGGCPTPRAASNFIFHATTAVSADRSHQVHRANLQAGRCTRGAFPGHGMLLVGSSRCDCDPFLYGFSAFGSDAAPAPAERVTERGPGKPAPSTEGGWRTAARDVNRTGWAPDRIGRDLREVWRVRLARTSHVGRTKVAESPAGTAQLGKPVSTRLPPGNRMLATAVPAASPVARSGLQVGENTGFDPLSSQWERHVTAHAVGGPAVADGIVALSLPHAHTVVGLDPDTGAERWRHRAQARVDGTPTIAGGRALFGDAAGWVSAISVGDGQLIWRTLVGPGRRFRVESGQIESSHPIPASVAVLGDKVYAMAGFHTQVDGGFHWAELALDNGAILRSGQINGEPRPFSAQDMSGYPGEDVFHPKYKRGDGRFQKILGTYPSSELAVAYTEQRIGYLTQTPEGWLGLGMVALDPKSGVILRGGKDYGFVSTGHWGIDIAHAPRYPVHVLTGPMGKFGDQVVMGPLRGRAMAYNGNRVVAVGCAKATNHKENRFGWGYGPRASTIALYDFQVGGDCTERWSVPYTHKTDYSGRTVRKDAVRDRTPEEAMAVAGETALVAQYGKLMLFDLADGTLLETLDLPAFAANSGIAIANSRVYVSCLDGSVLSYR